MWGAFCVLELTNGKKKVLKAEPFLLQSSMGYNIGLEGPKRKGRYHTGRTPDFNKAGKPKKGGKVLTKELLKTQRNLQGEPSWKE